MWKETINEWGVAKVDLTKEFKQYEQTIRSYSDAINKKIDQGKIDEAHSARLFEKLNEWFVYNTIRLGEVAKGYGIR